MSSPILKVTKLQAAQRQLVEAVRLFFDQRDIVSVHTLAGAAFGVLSDLAGHQGLANPLRDNDRIRPERKGEWIKAINAAQNFFKHADRDPNAVFDFKTGATPFLLMEAIGLFGSLASLWVPETYVFFLWFGIAHPDVLKNGDLRDRVLAGLADGVSPHDMTGWSRVLRATHEKHKRGEWPLAKQEGQPHA